MGICLSTLHHKRAKQTNCHSMQSQATNYVIIHIRIYPPPPQENDKGSEILYQKQNVITVYTMAFPDELKPIQCSRQEWQKVRHSTTFTLRGYPTSDSCACLHVCTFIRTQINCYIHPGFSR